MAIPVKSEIGKLKKVLLHRPGKELEHLVPGDLERLLFDDIPYLKTAQNEHDLFAGIMRGEGIEVVYLEDLTAEVLKGDEQLKKRFVEEFVAEGDITDESVKADMISYLLDIEDEKEMVLKMMSGVRVGELDVKSSHPLADLVKGTSQFILDPIPNLYFTRDPFACIGNGVSVNCMFSHTRRRETFFGKYVLENHPDFADTPFYYTRELPYSIEGGDVLNLSSKVLAIGISQRTTAEAIELLANNIFEDEKCEIETIIALDIPAIRAFMHLDTVCTQVDYDKFTIHPGILGTLKIYEITKGEHKGELKVKETRSSLADVLAKHLELDKVTLIQCGGKDTIASEREQWNDGSNTLCIAPGKVIVYDRNYVTNQILRENGIRVLEMASSELSRGRGGPRCMSMPLEREPLEAE